MKRAHEGHADSVNAHDAYVAGKVQSVGYWQLDCAAVLPTFSKGLDGPGQQNIVPSEPVRVFCAGSQAALPVHTG